MIHDSSACPVAGGVPGGHSAAHGARTRTVLISETRGS